MKLAEPLCLPDSGALPLASMKLAVARYYGADASLRVGVFCDLMLSCRQAESFMWLIGNRSSE